jgi:nitrile hydratase
MRLLANGRAAYVDELGLTRMPRPPPVTLVVKENTPTLQDSDLLHALLVHGIHDHRLPPDWYKDLEYRSRSCARSRTVLKEMGLDLPPSVDIRVWDTTAGHPLHGAAVQPAHTDGWSEEKLAKIVTKDAMIGVAPPVGSAHGRHA